MEYDLSFIFVLNENAVQYYTLYLLLECSLCVLCGL